MDPVRPDFEGACVTNLTPALVGGRALDWFPEAAKDARATVLLILDGLGWNALQTNAERLPTLSALDGRPITTVVPSTTVVALTSITTGLPPADHGIVAYRMRTSDGVLNLLRWTLQGGAEGPDPEQVQPRLAFAGQAVPAVTRAEYKETGFTKAHLRGARLAGVHSPSSIAEHCRLLVEAGERFVYAYYGGIDIVAHMHGQQDGFYPAELAFADRLTGDILDALPSDVALLVTSDHGHVQFRETVEIKQLEPMVELQTSEGRFRYLHARPGAADDLLVAAREAFGGLAWIFTRDELCDEGWLGPRAPSPGVRRRVGDVVLAAHEPVMFADPTNRGEGKLLSGHGSLTPDEMLVPLLGGRGRR